jgi:hypothetical protein
MNKFIVQADCVNQYRDRDNYDAYKHDYEELSASSIEELYEIMAAFKIKNTVVFDAYDQQYVEFDAIKEVICEYPVDEDRLGDTKNWKDNLNKRQEEQRKKEEAERIAKEKKTALEAAQREERDILEYQRLKAKFEGGE